MTMSAARKWLRTAQLVCGVWVTWTLIAVLLAPAAAADNCSVFTDCFGVANSAIEAAFGLSLLAVLSLVLDFVPFVGTAKGGIEALTGRDLLTGEELAPWERALGVLPFAAALGVIGTLARHADDLAGVDDLAGAGRAVDDVPAVALRERYPQVGETYPIRPADQHLIDTYRDPLTTSQQRTLLSEQLGEAGALEYVRRVSGSEGITLLRPTSDADVTGLIELADRGLPWDRAVAYNGRNATNVVYFDGKTLHVIEAKGGGGTYGDRESVFVAPDTRISQTHPEYPRDVAADMRNSGLQDGRTTIGSFIERSYRFDDVRYVGVRTGPYQELRFGTPETAVEHLFLEPPS